METITQKETAIQIRPTDNGYLVTSSIAANKHSPHPNYFSAFTYAVGYKAALHDIGYEIVNVAGNK